MSGFRYGFNGRPAPTVEFVNRAGQRVNPRTGKPLLGRVGRRGDAGVRSRLGNGISRKRRPLPIKRRGTMFGNLDPIPTNPRIDPPPRVCYNCWQPGHSRRNCPRPTVARFCDNCGRREEDLSTCPRCARVHKIFMENMKNGGSGYDEIDERDLYMFTEEDNQNGEDACDQVLREVMQQRKLLDLRQKELELAERQKELEIESLRRVREFDEAMSRSTPHEPVFRMSGVEREFAESRDDDDYPPMKLHPDLEEDPVTDVLKLAKTISHLSPETQDMIMRQVIAERREKRQLEVTDSWP